MPAPTGWARTRAAAAVREARTAVRSAAPHVVAAELALFLVALAAGFLQLLWSPPAPARVAAVAASACWAALLLPARRRSPVAALAATAPVLASGNVGAMAVLPIVSYATARRVHPARRLWTVVPATAAAGLLLALAVERDAPYGLEAALAGNAISVAVLLVFPALAGALRGQRRPRVRLLRERNAYLERAQGLAADKARMKERARIAAEMHDMLGHRLSLISMHAGALELTVARSAPELSAQAELLRTSASTAMSELRGILGVLRDATDEAPEAERSGTRADIADLVAESRKAGVDVELVWPGPDLAGADPRTRHALHRVVREGLTNVHKHAPAARTRVEVTMERDRVRVRVTNGPVPGTRPRSPGTRQGLVGLEERVALLQGALTAGPTPEGGFQIAADLPAHPSVPADPPVPREEPEPREVPPPLDAEVLTLPRVLGAGCLGALAAVPVVTGLAVLIVLSLLE
ncbi:histidine kinase [Actinomadura sp. NPDC047616]|uniref:sensor histidine kinase n=1 Tax=Actinomadura sp. NPDC047616 TaxID=3155914 RepID=UPI0033E62204